MSREMEMKKKILDMLSEMIMGEEGKRFAPKAVTVDVVTAKPGADLDEVLEEAREHNPVEDDLDEDNEGDYGHAEPDGDEMTGAEAEGLMEEDEEEEERKPKSLRDFFDRC